MTDTDSAGFSAPPNKWTALLIGLVVVSLIMSGLDLLGVGNGSDQESAVIEEEAVITQAAEPGPDIEALAEPEEAPLRPAEPEMPPVDTYPWPPRLMRAPMMVPYVLMVPGMELYVPPIEGRAYEEVCSAQRPCGPFYGGEEPPAPPEPEPPIIEPPGDFEEFFEENLLEGFFEGFFEDTGSPIEEPYELYNFMHCVQMAYFLDATLLGVATQAEDVSPIDVDPGDTYILHNLEDPEDTEDCREAVRLLANMLSDMLLIEALPEIFPDVPQMGDIYDN